MRSPVFPPNPVLEPAANEAATSSRQTWRDVFLVFLLSLPLFFWKLGGFGFFDPDEGRYAEIPREMLVNHDWITPTLNGVKYFEKPPLLYWLTATSFKLFGLNETAARLVPALCALLGLFLTYALGRRMFGRRAGLLSTVVLTTSIFWCVMARFIIIDMLLSVALFAASAFWWLGHSEENTRRRTLYNLGFWIALALGVLSKGPVAVLLVGASIVIYVVLCRQTKSLTRMNWALGIPLFLLITAPWFILVAMKNPEFNHFFWWGQNVARFLGIGKNREHVQSPWFFFENLPLLFLPWTFLLPAAGVAAWKRLWPARGEQRTEHQHAALYLLINATFILLFFSASTSKLLTYILPDFPALAILVAAYLDLLWRNRIEYSIRALIVSLNVFALLFGLLGLAALSVALHIVPYWANLLDDRIDKALTIPFSPNGYGIVLGIVFLGWSIAVFIASHQRNAKMVAISFGAGSTALLLTVFALLNTLSPDLNMAPLAAYIQPGLNRGAKLVAFDSYSQGVNFYTRQRVKLINGWGELDFGASQLSPNERRIWFDQTQGDGDLSLLQREMRSSQPVYCFVKNHKTAQRLLPQLSGAVEIVWNSRRSVLGNAAAAALTPPRSQNPERE